MQIKYRKYISILEQRGLEKVVSLKDDFSQKDKENNSIFFFFVFSSQKITQSITIIDYKLIQEIDTEELEDKNNRNWKIVKEIDERNKYLKNWIISCVLLQSTPKERAYLFEFLIICIQQFLELNNFNYFMFFF